VGNFSLISKIEQSKGVDNIDGIVEASELVMVARGDLGLDFPIEKVPEAQRKIIESSKRHGKPFIVATQVLTTMINSPIPTRAEVNDIANSVLSGAYGIMLSDETTVGKYPIEAVEILCKTIEETERSKN
jgi:pyruvate kinase